MPRRSRIDAPGAVHHVMARGIEKKNIFHDDVDREKFLDRFGKIIESTRTTCYAWVLMPNHFHLLLKTGATPISTVMRKLLTSHAVSFNNRHKRSGHVFQNRYKSILCQEEIYLIELIRYIHLNPLRADLVKSLSELNHYPYCGHATLKGKFDPVWQDKDYVLSLFDDDKTQAKRKYGLYIKDGVTEKNRPDLIGGGLIRSCGGWKGVKSLRKNKDFQMSDERILGDGSFVKKVLTEAKELTRQESKLKYTEINYKKIIEIAAKRFGVEANRIFMRSKQRDIVKARNLFCYWAVKELRMSMTEVANKLNVTISAVSQSFKKGDDLCSSEGISLEKEMETRSYPFIISTPRSLL